MTVAEAVGTGEGSITPRHVILTVGASVCGLLIHNLEEFPPSNLLAPEPTVSHYAAHAVYALAQLPLLWIACRGYRASARSD